MLTKEEVELVYPIGANDFRMVRARKMNNKLLLHVEGIGKDEALKKFNGYENELQKAARDKYSISNKFVTEELLRPTDNVFNARGGSKNYKFTTKQDLNEKEFVKILSNIKNGYSLNQYMEQIWFNKHIVDPNGLILIEESTVEIDVKDRTAWPTYKSIHSIRSYEQNGIFVDWVIFEPHSTEEVKSKKGNKPIKNETFWAVDEVNWYEYKLTEEGIEQLRKIKHSFDQVPAILCSNIIDNVSGWKKSPIDAQIELLDQYFVSNSILSIADFEHNYPIPWEYADQCSSCQGTGQIEKYEIRQNVYSTECTSCRGTGKCASKDVTDIKQLRVPTKDEVKLDPPAGYITLPPESLNLLVGSVERKWDLIFFTQWGTTVSKGVKSETATGRFLDAQPVNNRLNKYSTSAEVSYTALINFFGKYNFPETFDMAIVQLGRRYMIETPDQIWDKYIKAKKDNAPVTELNLLLFQFLESEFRENEQMLIYESKKTKLEPFVHWDIETVRKSMNISVFDKTKKEYFNEWCMRKTIEEINEKEIGILDGELDEFIKVKINQLKIEENGEII